MSTNLVGSMTNHSSQLFHFVIRLSKEDSAFFYFQLEANEGLCFYSTLPYEVHTQYRDIDLKGDIPFKNELEHILNMCQKKFPIEILVNETIEDKKSIL